MGVEVARVLAGSLSDAPHSATGARRCILVLPDSRHQRGYVKFSSPDAVAREIFCSLLLRDWGLPVPKPYLVAGPTGPAFGSTDISYPNLLQVFDYDKFNNDPILRQTVIPKLNEIISKKICSLKTTPLATACDEAINNRDRHFGNILWDGVHESWIDYDQTLGHGVKPDHNLLCQIAMLAQNAMEICNKAIFRGGNLSQNGGHVSHCEADVAITGLPTGSMAHFVHNRLVDVCQRITDRFNGPSATANTP